MQLPFFIFIFALDTIDECILRISSHETSRLRKMLSHKIWMKSILNPADMKFINLNKGVVKCFFHSHDSLAKVRHVAVTIRGIYEKLILIHRIWKHVCNYSRECSKVNFTRAMNLGEIITIKNEFAVKFLKRLFISFIFAWRPACKEDLSALIALYFKRNITKLIFCFAYFFRAIPHRRAKIKLIIGREGNTSKRLTYLWTWKIKASRRKV